MAMPLPLKAVNCRTYHFAHGVNLGGETARFGIKVCDHILLLCHDHPSIAERALSDSLIRHQSKMPIRDAEPMLPFLKLLDASLSPGYPSKR